MPSRYTRNSHCGAMNGDDILSVAPPAADLRARYDLTHAGHLCAALTARGINTANLEYRRVGSPGGGWPRTFEDVRTAYRYLIQRAGELAIAASPVIVLGHSAGAQLALCLAAHESSVSNCISLAGVLDLRRA